MKGMLREKWDIWLFSKAAHSRPGPGPSVPLAVLPGSRLLRPLPPPVSFCPSQSFFAYFLHLCKWPASSQSISCFPGVWVHPSLGALSVGHSVSAFRSPPTRAELC